MPNQKTSLEQEFLDDHKHLTRGFSEILEAIAQDDFVTAARLAQQLDQVAGPHIRFEEEILYPELRKVRGQAYAGRLYREHGQALSALQTLQKCAEKGLPPDERAQVVHQLQTGLDHAVSCGTLLSHLTILEPKRQKEMLATLLSMRAECHSWSSLPPRKTVVD